METIRGIVTRVLKEDEDTGRVFLTVQYESDGGLSVAKLGAFARGVRAGDAFVADGEWKTSQFRGQSEEIFEGKQLRPDLPRTAPGAERFLSAIFSEREHAIAQEAIRRLIDTSGPEVLRRAIDKPDILVNLSRHPKECRSAIIAAWENRTKGRRAVSLMEKSGLETKVIDRIIGAWRDEALPRLTGNPYGAARIPLVGFGNADRVGQHLGVDRHDRRRLTAAVSEVLRAQQERGSTAADITTLLANLGNVSGIDRESLRRFLEDAASRSDHDFAIYAAGGEPVCAPLRLYSAEADIVNGVYRLLARGPRRALDRVRAAAATLFERPEFARFDAVQRAAVIMAASEPFSILTGGPGTGKSTVMDAVARLSDELDNGPLFLVAPTGMAAKRLASATGRKASTAHRLLKARGDRTTGSSSFMVNRDNPLPNGSVVVVDEASMLDAETMAALLNALGDGSRLLLVGDRNQLPSVGAGAVLADLLSAEAGGRKVVPSVALINVYRQTKDSGIAHGAAQICRGEIPQLDAENKGGVSFDEMPSFAIVDEIERLVCQTLPDQGYDPLRDVAVLIPQAPGQAGTWEVNRRLSARLNPDGGAIPGVFRGQDDDPRLPIPRIGDRVMLTENDPDNDLMNGDLGLIVGTGRTRTNRPTIKIKFDCGVDIDYPAARWRSIILAYAGTVHKSQGSQYPVVIMAFASAHERMQERALVYTGWTRAQSRLHLLGERSVLEKAIRTYRGEERMTLLRRFISAIRADALHRPGQADWDAIASEAQAKCMAERLRAVTANGNEPAAPGAAVGRIPRLRPFAGNIVAKPATPAPPPEGRPRFIVRPFAPVRPPPAAAPAAEPVASPSPKASAPAPRAFTRPGGLFQAIAQPKSRAANDGTPEAPVAKPRC